MLATAGNLNNDIGMPLTLLRLRARASLRGDRDGHEPSGRDRATSRSSHGPTSALVNNAGIAHIGELGSREAIAHAKGEIYEGLRAGGIALINADDEFAAVLARAESPDARVVDFGIERPAAVSAQYETERRRDSLITVRTPDTQYRGAPAACPGVHNVRNALAAAAVAYALGVAPGARRSRTVGTTRAPRAGCSASARASGAHLHR